MSGMRFATRRAFLGAALALGLAACGPQAPTFMGSDVTGADVGHDFSLTDFNGKRRTLADFRGKVVVMFFGYTHCPDVCPTTLAQLSQTMQQLGPDADRVQVLFVTVDPERDTPAMLAKYVPAFDKRFLGLYGTADETAATAKAYKVLYEKVAGPTPDDYTMNHSAGTYLYDPQGRLRVFVAYGQGGGAEVFTHDIRELLRVGT
ncbi:MAG: SCO family protein [Proteobacteria bacterium]|nr:SCO family protein [Pseudomonadota bacterium]